MTHEFFSASSSTHSSTCFNGGLKTATAAAKDGQNSDAFLDRLARLAIAELMQKEEFQKIWIQKAIELEEMEIKARQEEAEKSEKEIPARLILDLRRRSLHSDENYSPQCHPEDPQKSNTPSNRPNPLFAQQFGQLAQRLELAIEAFLGGTQLAYSSASVDCGFSDRKRFSREAASFYSVRIQLERFCSSGRLHPAQFGLVAHIIGKLHQIFANFVSIPYSVEKATFLANTLFQMLGQLLEYCLLFEQINELAEVAWLRRTLKQFGIKVCRRLNKLLQSTQNKRKSSPAWPTSTGRSTTPPGKLHRSTSLRCLDVAMANKRVVLIPFKLKQPSQQKGFLLSPELNYERARMPGRAERSKSSENIKYLSAQGEDLLLGGIRTGEEKEELRKACRLAREMIEKIAGRVDRK